MPDLSNVSLLVQAGALAPVGIAFLVFLALVGLRLFRRGSARFWTAPAAMGLVLLPAVLGAGLAALLFRQTASALALVDFRGVGALAAGLAEALIPLLVGLVCVAALAFAGLLLVGVGSSRGTEAESSGDLTWPSAALLAVVLSTGLVAFLIRLMEAVSAGWRDAPGLLLQLNGSLLGSAALATILFALAVVSAVRAPRGPSATEVKVAALSGLSLCGLLALGGAWAVYGDLQCYTSTALTGVPCDAAPGPVAVDESPTPAPEDSPSPPPPAVAVKPPPPPPPPIPQSRTSAAPTPPRIRRPLPSPEGSQPRNARSATPGGAAARPVDAEENNRAAKAVRVGGQIKEPKKIKNVAPEYPPIAIQARVEGIVIVECTIDEKGKVTRAAILRGIPLLDGAAVAAIKQWVYEPTLLNGAPVPVVMTVTVNFKLGPR